MSDTDTQESSEFGDSSKKQAGHYSGRLRLLNPSDGTKTLASNDEWTDYLIDAEPPKRKCSCRCCVCCSSCLQTANFFCRYSCRDMFRNKCNFCLAFFSVMVVVLSTLVIKTVTAKGPIVFLKIGESSSGQYDAVISPTSVNFADFDDFQNWVGVYMNYTQVLELYGTDTYNLSPRKQFCSSNVGSGLGSWSACLMLMDTNREAQIDLGVNYPFEPIPAGECLLSVAQEQKHKYEIGDSITMEVKMSYMLNVMIDNYNAYLEEREGPNPKNEQVHISSSKSNRVDLPCKISGFMSESYGKFPEDDNQVVMEYAPFTAYLINYLETTTKHIQPGFIQFLLGQAPGQGSPTDQMWAYADMIMYTLPAPRYKYYEDSDYDVIQANVLHKVDEVVDAFGLYPVMTQTELLDSMQLYQFAVLFLGMVFQLLNILFVSISTLLIYSLLMITVEKRTFQNGVLRLVGLRKTGFVAMILFQSAMFVIPSIVVGFIASYPCLMYLYGVMFTEKMGFDGYSNWPSVPASLEALALGFIIPILASIVPIRRALSKSLNESLNYHRTKTMGTKVTIQDENAAKIAPLIVFGVLAVTYGIVIYYVLPLSLLSQDFSLLLTMFFVILVGMICGLSILAFNLQGLTEQLILNVLLCWESTSMKRLLQKNLMAHKGRNKLTSIIYSLTLANVIFLVTALSLQLQEIQMLDGDSLDYDVSIYSGMSATEPYEDQPIKPVTADPILQAHSDLVEEFAFNTEVLAYQIANEYDEVVIHSMSELETCDWMRVIGLQPSGIIDRAFDIETLQDPSSGLGLSDQLYTARGSQGNALEEKCSIILNLDAANYEEMVTMQAYTDDANSYWYLRPIFTFNRGELLYYPQASKWSKYAFMSLPMWSIAAYGPMNNTRSFEDTVYSQLMIKAKDMGDGGVALDNLVNELTEAFEADTGYVNTKFNTDGSGNSETIDKVTNILNKIFNIIITITMFLCFFALSSNMAANLIDQKKEVAVMRAIGITKNRLRMLYFYEALVLVFASCILGVIIGMLVGYTMMLQQSLFLDMSLPFFFPTKQFVLIFGLSIICAFLSTVGASSALLRHEIADIFRG